MQDDLARFLDLTPEQARRQWRRIASREPRPRQERFLPVEVQVSYTLFFVLDPHRYGGGNIHTVPQEARLLASALKRTPGSITSKMLNLDGSRTNCARSEPELFLRLASSPGRAAALCRTALEAAREMGLGPERIPDVLGVLDAGGMDLFGQDEIGSTELDQVLGENARQRESIGEAFGFREVETTKIVEQKVRLGQHRFARQVLTDYGHRCGFCGFSPSSLKGHRLLVASHIKPWRASNNRERLDPRNGIAACPTHDSAFDTGLLTVNGGLRVHQSQHLTASVATDQHVHLFFGEGVVGPRLHLPQDTPGPRARYLAYHHDHVFRDEMHTG
jgi:putative restriction endonuclease